MLTNDPFRAFLVAACLVQAMTAAASAQSANGVPGRHIDIERAVRLETDAESLFSEPKRYAKAARMFREAARLRPDEDRRALESLQFAGVLAYHAKDFRASRAVWLEQAERALSLGEVGTAAIAFINAALVAKKLNDVAAFDYVARARLLATSTLLAAEDRASITERIGDDPTTVAERRVSRL